jgi:excisionase family DNA binding protein
MEKLSVSLAEAERLTSVSRFTLRRQIKRGVLNFARVGRRLVIPLAELQKLITPKEQPATKPKTICKS